MSRKNSRDPNLDQLPLRVSVGIMLVDRDGRVWLGKRRPRWAASTEPDTLQMPQGGLLPGEDPITAALRELEEETGVTSVKIITTSEVWRNWELPAELVGVALKGRYRGQRQRWVLARFTGSDAEIDIGGRHGKKPEFTDWMWCDRGAVAALAVEHKRALYEHVLAEFEPFVLAHRATIAAE